MKLDLKSVLTMLVVSALIVFTGIIIFRIEMTSEIAIMFISAFILFANNIANYYFNKQPKVTAKEEIK